MLEPSENSNPVIEETDESNLNQENQTIDLQLEAKERGILDSLEFEKLTHKLIWAKHKQKVTPEDDKWKKICKITRNILQANLKQYNTEENKTTNSNFNPLIISDNLKLPTDYTPLPDHRSISLWSVNTLEFISLASASKGTSFPLSFKLLEVQPPRQKFPEQSHPKHKGTHKPPAITIQGKPFKYDSSQLISLIQKSQRATQEDQTSESKGRVLEKFNLKGEVKIPPNWDKRVGYDSPNWDMPSGPGTGSIFSLGELKDDRKEMSTVDMVSATNALKNLSVLVSDFQVVKKNKGDGTTEDIAPLNINDINNFAFVDDDLDDSLKCSRFSKFFKVLKDQKGNQN